VNSNQLLRRAAAEALGTGLLVTAVVGSGIMAERLTGDVALALLANAVATAAALVVLITLLRPISGAHLNPAVSLVAWFGGEIRASEAAAYLAAQFTGAIAGTILAHLMFDLPVLQLSLHVRSGPSQWLSEVVATAGLVLVVLLGSRRQSGSIPALVGLYIGAAYWFTASTSFANPAVTLARAFTDTFSGIAPVDVPGFMIAQLAGAAAGLAIARLLSPSEAAR
jgi:glycerol uptake facilitator-like aquaporin